MEVAEHLEALRHEGEVLAAAADRTDLDTPLPTTPEWRLRDLLHHIGDVHRWARAHVAEGRLRPIGREELTALAGPLPDDAGLLDWFREGHAGLVRTLETADPATECWTFLPAPSPLAFWTRRQAHETGIHRADAESPAGPEGMSPYAPPFAADGIDEMLFGFLSGGNGDLRADPPRTLRVHAADTGDDWWMRFGDDVQVRRDDADADCSVRGPASDLHLLLWNRRSPDGLEVQGDASILDFWRRNSQVVWSRPR